MNTACLTLYPVEWNFLNPRIPLIRTFSRSVAQTAFREGADKCGVAKMPVRCRFPCSRFLARARFRQAGAGYACIHFKVF